MTPSFELEWTVEAFPRWNEEDQVWYPNVRWLLNGNFDHHHEYIIGFEDAATAATFARTLRTEEIERFNAIAADLFADPPKPKSA